MKIRMLMNEGNSVNSLGVNSFNPILFNKPLEILRPFIYTHVTHWSLIKSTQNCQGKMLWLYVFLNHIVSQQAGLSDWAVYKGKLHHLVSFTTSLINAYIRRLG